MRRVAVGNEAQIKEDVLCQVLANGLSQCFTIESRQMETCSGKKTISIAINSLPLHAVNVKQAIKPLVVDVGGHILQISSRLMFTSSRFCVVT